MGKKVPEESEKNGTLRSTALTQPKVLVTTRFGSLIADPVNGTSVETERSRQMGPGASKVRAAKMPYSSYPPDWKRCRMGGETRFAARMVEQRLIRQARTETPLRIPDSAARYVPNCTSAWRLWMRDRIGWHGHVGQLARGGPFTEVARHLGKYLSVPGRRAPEGRAAKTLRFPSPVRKTAASESIIVVRDSESPAGDQAAAL